MNEEYESLKKRVDEIRKEQARLDKQIEKQEDDGNDATSLYERLEELESERNELEMILNCY